jgi:hypothetical protein
VVGEHAEEWCSSGSGPCLGNMGHSNPCSRCPVGGVLQPLAAATRHRHAGGAGHEGVERSGQCRTSETERCHCLLSTIFVAARVLQSQRRGRAGVGSCKRRCGNTALSTVPRRGAPLPAGAECLPVAFRPNSGLLRTFIFSSATHDSEKQSNNRLAQPVGAVRRSQEQRSVEGSPQREGVGEGLVGNSRPWCHAGGGG